MIQISEEITFVFFESQLCCGSQRNEILAGARSIAESFDRRR